MAKGDHLRVRMGTSFGITTHHGIDMGDGTIVHFSKKRLGALPVIDRTLWEDFFRNAVGNAEVVPHHNPLSPDQVVAAANHCFRHSREIPYDVFESNCEHIATWCKTGYFRSLQASRGQEAKSWLELLGEVGLGFLTSGV